MDYSISMNQRMTFSLTLKLTLLTSLPFLAFVGFALMSIAGNLSQMGIMESQTRSLAFMQLEVPLVNYLQQERGRTSIYLRSDTGRQDVEVMRGLVDQALPPFVQALAATGLSAAKKDTLARLAQQIADIRRQVDAGGAVPASIFDAWTGLIQSVLESGNAMANLPTTGGIGKRITSINTLLLATEYLGKFRGAASGVLSGSQPIGFDQFLAILRDYDGVNLSIDSPAIILSERNKNAQAELRGRPEWATVKAGLEDLANNWNSAAWTTETQPFWDAASALINTIKETILSELAEIRQLNTQVEQDLRLNLIVVLVIAILTTIFITIMSSFLIRRILTPVRQISTVLEAMAQGAGDLTHEVAVSGTDEIAGLGLSFNHFLAGISRLVADLRTGFMALDGLASQLIANVETSARSGGDIFRASGELEQMAAEQSGLAGSSRQTIHQLLDSLEELSLQINDQSAGVIESSASIEQMIANVNTVTGNIEHAGQSISELAEASRQGRLAMDQAGQEAANAATLSRTLGEINKAISTIAAQTNLLAMNAAIEAAHAGDAGRGFAVVADEIRNLATTAAGQTKKITEALKSMHTAMERTVAAAGQSSQAFARIDGLVQGVVSATQEIKLAMNEQTTGSSEILKAIATMTESTERVREQSGMMSEGSRAVLADMDRLMDASSRTALLASRLKTSMGQIDSELNRGLDTGQQTRDRLEQVSQGIKAFKVRDSATS